MPSKRNAEIYLQHKDLLIRVVNLETVGETVYELPNWFEWIAAYRCKQCNQIAILCGEMEHYDRLQREMGFEEFYGSTDVLYCPNCKNEITVETFVNCYAMSWFCEFECNDAELVQVNDLWLYIEKSHDKSVELEKLKNEQAYSQQRLELLAEHAQKTNGYVLIVEGDDDEEVWNRLLKRRGVDMSRVNIAKYGKGGLDAAIKAAKYFKGKILKSIPHKLVVDSNNKPRERRRKLEKSGIKNYHILEKKEIESYLLEPKALSQILNVDPTVMSKEFKKISPHAGKEQLDNLFKKFIDKKATPSAKGLIAGALEKIPREISKIIDEIKAVITKLNHVIQDPEDYEY